MVDMQEAIKLLGKLATNSDCAFEALQVATEALTYIRDWGDGNESPSCASVALSSISEITARMVRKDA